MVRDPRSGHRGGVLHGTLNSRPGEDDCPCLIGVHSYIPIYRFYTPLRLVRFPHCRKLYGKEADVNSAPLVLLKIHGAPSRQKIYYLVCNIS